MPVYTCITAAKTLADQTKAALAAEITKIHSSITGAPTSFVHVVFQELPATNLFTDSSPSQPLLITASFAPDAPTRTRCVSPKTSPRAAAGSRAFRRRAFS